MPAAKKTKQQSANPLLRVLFRLLYLGFVLTIIVLEFPGVEEVANSPSPGISARNLVIQAIQEDGPNRNKNIRPGDVIFRVGGDRVRNRFHYTSILKSNESFEPLEYVLVRDGREVTVAVEFESIKSRRLVRHLGQLALAVAFLLVGTWVYLRRPDLLGSLFALNCAILAFFLTHRPSASNPALQLFGELIHDAVMLAFPAFFLHFFLVFPDRQKTASTAERVWRLLPVYATPVALYIITALVVVNSFYLRPVANGVTSIVVTASTLYFGLYILASLVLFIRSYRSSPRAQKQKLRVVTAGTLAGILPFVITLVIQQVAPTENYFLEFATVLLLGFVPATFAYAILKHGAIELTQVVRKGLVYAVLTGAIVALYYVIVDSVGNFLLKELNVARQVFMPFAVLVLAVTFAPARARLQHLVDRLFYRGEYKYRREVFEFNRQLARKLKQEQIFDCFTERVEGLLKSSFIAVYANGEENELVLASTNGECPDLPETFSLQSFLGRFLSRHVNPLLVEFLDSAWKRPSMDTESKRILRVPGLAVCVPVVVHGRFLSVILLGEKKSGLVYSGNDAELLATFSEQMALVLQNAELLESSIEQERLLNEVMLARDIQLSLLPPSPPDNPQIDIYGTMVSSFEVGGDYYDYFYIDHDRIAIAIGDVSGKGVPAAMLMSSLQAVFKNLAIKSRLAPAELNAELNEYLANHATTEKFATFFYGVIDLHLSRFDFSNAGHCPALLVKNDYVDRLGAGGMVLGVRKDATYREGNVLIEPGDLLMLYTDGITEQKNTGGEEYGEERLIDFLSANKELPVKRLQTALFEDVMAFGEGQQQDDITCVFVYKKMA